MTSLRSGRRSARRRAPLIGVLALSAVLAAGVGQAGARPPAHATPLSSDRTRIAGARFVLGRLTSLNREGPLAGRLDLGRIAMVGHSAGGATAASVMQLDRRVIAGVDIDGRLRGGVEKVDLNRPFMFLRAHRGKSDDFFMNAVDFRTKQSGPLVTATFSHVRHLGFSDFMLLVPQLEQQVPGLRKLIPIGTADPHRTVATQKRYVRAFLDTYLRDRPSPLLGGGTSLFADVEVTTQTSATVIHGE